MKSTSILALLLVTLIINITPSQAEASEAIQINDTNVMFLIDFHMPSDFRSYEVPIMASSRVRYTDRSNSVGYSLKSSDADIPSISTVTAVVLSQAKINENNHYIIKQDSIENFRLAIFATFSEPITSAAMAQITKIPYWIDGKRTTVHQNQLDELEAAILRAE